MVQGAAAEGIKGALSHVLLIRVDGLHDSDLTAFVAANPKSALPRDPANGCAVVYPHQFLRETTVFEVIKAAGLPTAWSDKHPAYDSVQGPSGKGVDDLFVPEINSDAAITAKAANTEAYDDTKVAAVLNQIVGNTSADKPGAVPAIFGMNFQAISVGEKTAGYTDAAGTPSADLAAALAHTDAALGKVPDALAAAIRPRTAACRIW